MERAAAEAFEEHRSAEARKKAAAYQEELRQRALEAAERREKA